MLVEVDPRGQFVTFFAHPVSTVHLIAALMRLSMIVMGDVTDICVVGDVTDVYLRSRLSGVGFRWRALGLFLPFVCCTLLNAPISTVFQMCEPFISVPHRSGTPSSE